MSNNPAVAVIIPTHNRAHVLKRALHSVLYQTYKNLEVIVVDDASTDNTEDVVKETNDPRVVYIRHEVRKGAAAARNSGIRAASTGYIAFQDSDDEWLCEKLEKQMDVMLRADPKVGVVYTMFLRLEAGRCNSYPAATVTKRSGNILDALLEKNFITTQSVLIRKDCFLKAGLFDESLPRLQDWELFIRMAIHYEFQCIEEHLLLATHTADSITANPTLLPFALKLILAKHYHLFKQHKNLLAKQYYSLGRLLCAEKNIAEGRMYFWKALQARPFKLMCYVRLLTTVFGFSFNS